MANIYFHNSLHSEDPEDAYLSNPSYRQKRVELESDLARQSFEDYSPKTFIDLPDGSVLVASTIIHTQQFDWDNIANVFIKKRGRAKETVEDEAFLN